MERQKMSGGLIRPGNGLLQPINSPLSRQVLPHLLLDSSTPPRAGRAGGEARPHDSPLPFSFRLQVSPWSGARVCVIFGRREQERVQGGGGEDDRGGAERPAGEEGAGEVQRGRHNRRPQEAGGGADRDEAREDPHPEVVQHLQGPHHPQGLRDPRWDGSRALLQLNSPLSLAIAGWSEFF